MCARPNPAPPRRRQAALPAAELQPLRDMDSRCLLGLLLAVAALLGAGRAARAQAPRAAAGGGGRGRGCRARPGGRAAGGDALRCAHDRGRGPGPGSADPRALPARGHPAGLAAAPRCGHFSSWRHPR